MDLFAIAVNNDASLAKRYEAAMGGSPNQKHLAQFSNVILTKGRISINARLWVLSTFLSGGEFHNMLKYCQELATLSAKPLDEILRHKLGAYYEKRIKFDKHFTGASEWHYGALNIGGMGASNYGPFCIVFGPELNTSKQTILYLKEDSLNAYSDDDGTVRIVELSEDISTDAAKHYLATLKLTRAIETSEPAEWAELLCSNNDYIEVVISTQITTSHIEELRVSEEEWHSLFDLAFEDMKRKLTNGERALAHDFVQVLANVRKHNVAIRSIP